VRVNSAKVGVSKLMGIRPKLGSSFFLIKRAKLEYKPEVVSMIRKIEGNMDGFVGSSG
jgi:hypothetical protein